MVKNSGGNKGKKVARKHISGNSFNAKLRFAEEDEERYACVTKLLGNGMCNVNCLDGTNSKQRLCIIRNKFRGRGKRDNTVAIGTYVLVGVREWESSKSNSLEKCDLIEVSNSNEAQKLKSQVDKPWELIHVSTIIHVKREEKDEMFAFGNENTELKEEIEQSVLTTETESDTFFCDEILDIDDI